MTLLKNWKDYYYQLSSDLSITKTMDRKNVDYVFETLKNYFGENYFTTTISENNQNRKNNWLHYLLANPKNEAGFASLFEICNSLNYLSKLSKSYQKKFKTLLNDPRQLRDFFYEIYIFRLLDYNNIKINEKPKEGEKELDAVCLVNNEEYLCECRKLYTANLVLMESFPVLFENLIIKLSNLNKGFGFIVTFKFFKENDLHTKNKFIDKINSFFIQYNQREFHTIDYHQKSDYGEFSIVNYNIENNFDIESKKSLYHIILKMIPPASITLGMPNHYSIEIGGSMALPQYKINQKLFGIIEEKREQHKNSAYKNKLYFFDNEMIPDFNQPLFAVPGMFDENSVNEYINLTSENEIFVFTMRKYLNNLPEVTIKVMGKNISPDTKRKIENLKTDFDYYISY